MRAVVGGALRGGTGAGIPHMGREHGGAGVRRGFADGHGVSNRVAHAGGVDRASRAGASVEPGVGGGMHEPAADGVGPEKSGSGGERGGERGGTDSDGGGREQRELHSGGAAGGGGGAAGGDDGGGVQIHGGRSVAERGAGGGVHEHGLRRYQHRRHH